jgi:alkanesulfonate monooxygenase SsuD/methylene tetrahydromethanopterin reductase-like flavin-dependent oxidoreductase (luciferase family)
MDKDEIEYGYPIRTPAQRLDALADALPRIRRRLGLLQPGPVGRLPILIGGNGERRTLRLVARHADMWNGYGDAATIRAKNAIIDRWCDEIGRDPREIERTVWIDEAEPELMRSLVEAGADHVILGLRAPYDLDQVKRLVAARLAF